MGKITMIPFCLIFICVFCFNLQAQVWRSYNPNNPILPQEWFYPGAISFNSQNLVDAFRDPFVTVNPLDMASSIPLYLNGLGYILPGGYPPNGIGLSPAFGDMGVYLFPPNIFGHAPALEPTWPGMLGFGPFGALGNSLSMTTPLSFGSTSTMSSDMEAVAKIGDIYILWPADTELLSLNQALMQGLPCQMIPNTECVFDGCTHHLFMPVGLNSFPMIARNGIGSAEGGS